MIDVIINHQKLFNLVSVIEINSFPKRVKELVTPCLRWFNTTYTGTTDQVI
jgi:hypothetical protein